ncbi:MAG: ribonuclease D [Alphaproteobacteria bacterium]|nr:ribonuclease D [Alphaproteobacteria bacterium]
MSIVRNTDALAELCQRLARQPAIIVDTEFMRDRSYWSKLCLVQVAAEGQVWAIDPLAEGIELSPLHDLMAAPDVLKVFHAARQDLEIFFHATGLVPGPLFDTQVAAMVCGLGEQIGFEMLVQRLTGRRLDKSAQFTDWARRPLSPRQLDYALADVRHLAEVYKVLEQRLKDSGRAHWLNEEMAILADPGTYALVPEQAWRRLKPRGRNPRYLGVLKEVAAWRELEAQRRDLPRGHVLRDEAVLELAAERPTGADGLRALRAVPKSFADNAMGEGLLNAIRRGLELPEAALPVLAEEPQINAGPALELLKVLLKQQCNEHGVAAKLVASSEDLARIASDPRADLPALSGWRREVFGDAALALLSGRLALTARKGRIELLAVNGGTK